MKEKILYIADMLRAGEISTHHAEQALYETLSLTSKYNRNEIYNVLSKLQKVKVKENLREILMEELNHDYPDKEDVLFFKKYSGKICYVYKYYGDWWIAEDDNMCLTENCFEFNI